MKRRIFCATATLLAGIGIAGHAMAQTKWDFATAYGPGNFHSKNNELFVKIGRASCRERVSSPV